MRSHFAQYRRALMCSALAIFALGVVTAGSAIRGAQPAQPKNKFGLQVNDPKAFQGYTLLSPLSTNKTYLVDMEGTVVHTWDCDCPPGGSACLLENGNLLRAGSLPVHAFGNNPGAGGRLQEYSWDGKLVWDIRYDSPTYLPHHDICKMPNGNLLLLVWQKKAPNVALAAGRRPETLSNNFLIADSILEVQPTAKNAGKIVWEWHVWDHLIQDYDSQKPNFGDVAAHPELIDLNFGEGTIASMIARPEELEKLRAIGYVGGPDRRPNPPQTDWLHCNALDYNAELDQIMISVHEFNEIWVIDHSTSKAEAATHKGGKYGKGGDLLYRWGNPRAYRHGTVKDQKLFGQHNAHWIDKGLPGAGNILIFNNGLKRIGGAYSSLEEIAPPVDAKGKYEYTKGRAFGPDKPAWSYRAPKRIDFYAAFMSGVQRLPNGNTFVCSGTNGTVFEVTPKDEVVWKFAISQKSRLPGGPPIEGNLFRAHRYAPDYPGLKDKNLKPAKGKE